MRRSIDPARSFSYSFVGTPPIPVLTSRNTVTLDAVDGTVGPATRITWTGEYDLLADDRDTVDHINRRVVWPATLDALASTIGVEYTLDATDTEDRNAS